MALLRTSLVLLAVLWHVPSAFAAPENGWWWNPNESGRGFFVEIVNGFAYVGAYVYAPDGRADWVVSSGTMTSPLSYSGRLLSFRGGQTLVGDYKAPGPATDVGALDIQFSDDRHATLTWPGGTVPIERLAFGAATPAPVPRTGWWWNADQSGTGYSIEVQGSTLFVVGFMYDDAGNPIWYYASGTMSSPTSWSAPVYRFAGGQAIGAPYRAPAAPANVGTMSLQFYAPDEAKLTLSDAPDVVIAKQQRDVPLTPTLPPPQIDLPESWAGTFTREYQLDTSTPSTNVHEHTTIVFSGVWSNPLASLPGAPRSYAIYDFVGTVGITYQLMSDVRDLAVCSYSAQVTLPAPGGSTLTVYEDGTYTMNVLLSHDVVGHGICTTRFGSQPATTLAGAHVNAIRYGTVANYRIFRELAEDGQPAPGGTMVTKTRWAFEAAQ
jgi:hypothetical protein